MSYTREQLLQIQSSARVKQAQWDEIFQPWGMRAPEPVFGQLPDEYDREMAVKAKKLLPDEHKLRETKYWRLRNDAFEALKPQLQNEVKDAAYRADTVPLGGPLRRVEKIDQNGLKMWSGSASVRSLKTSNKYHAVFLAFWTWVQGDTRILMVGTCDGNSRTLWLL